MKKRLWTILLCVSLIVGLMPSTAFANSDAEVEEEPLKVYVYAKTVDSTGADIRLDKTNLDHLGLKYNSSNTEFCWLNLGELKSKTAQTLTEKQYGSGTDEFTAVIKELKDKTTGNNNFNHSHNKSLTLDSVEFYELKKETGKHNGMSTENRIAYHLDGSLTLYKVTFDANTTDAVSNMPTGSGYYYTGYAFPSTTTPVRDSYTFTGWHTDSSCETDFEGATTVTKDITLYAGWEQNGSGSEKLPNLTVTKTFKGVTTPPQNFEIVLSVDKSDVLTFKTTDEDVETTANSNGTVTYTWKKYIEVETGVGTTFTVEERSADIDGYTRSTTYNITEPTNEPPAAVFALNDDGTGEIAPSDSKTVYVAEGKTSTVNITNTYTKNGDETPTTPTTPTTKTYPLTISKQVAGLNSVSADYAVTISVANNYGTVLRTLTLKAGESKTVYLPYGAYTLSETAPTVDGYTLTAQNFSDNGFVLSSSKSVTLTNTYAENTEKPIVEPEDPTDDNNPPLAPKEPKDTNGADNGNDTENANDVPKTGDDMTQSMLLYLLAAAAALLGIRKTAKSQSK